MSIWDTEVFTNDTVLDFLDEVDGLDEDQREEALIDTCQIALSADDENEQLAGLAAAVIAAIWAGAPFSSSRIVEDYAFIKEGIGEYSEELMETATEVFDALSGITRDGTSHLLEDFAEAVE